MIANRYAKALLNLALKEGAGENVKQDMLGIRSLLEQRSYMEFMNNRMILPKDKISIFEECHPLTRDFIQLVIKSKREHYLHLMALEYIKQVNKALNVEDVEVSLKSILKEKDKLKLSEAIAKKLKKKVNINYVQDKTIIGGVKMKYGNKTIDGTVSGVLLRFYETLTRN